MVAKTVIRLLSGSFLRCIFAASNTSINHIFIIKAMYIEKINGPADVKRLSAGELETLSG